MRLPSLGALRNLKLPNPMRARSPGRGSDLICIIIWPDRVDVSHVVTKDMARPRIERCESYPRAGGDVAVLKRLRRQLHLDRYRCTTLLKTGDYQIIQVEAPNVLPEEMQNAVRWRIRDMIDFPAEEATVDSVSIPGSEGAAGGPAQLFAVAARNQVIAAAIKPFDDADIALEVVDIPEFAQRNLARCLEPQERGVALLALNERGGLLTFTCGGELYQHRRIDITLASLRGAPTEQRESVELQLESESPYERLVVELQRSLDYFERQFPRVTLAKLVVTPVVGADDLRPFLVNRLDIPVELLYLSQVMDFPDVVELHEPARQAQRVDAIGAALRMEGTA